MNTPDKIRVLVYEPGKPGKFCRIDNTLPAIRAIVGGYIQVIALRAPLVIVCNEDGLPLGLPPNRGLHGSFFVTAIEGAEFVGLPDDPVSDQKAASWIANDGDHGLASLLDLLSHPAGYGEMYEPAMAITDRATAAKYLDVLVVARCHALGESESDAIARVRDDLGYWAGYYGTAVRERVEDLFDCEHPIFGKHAVHGSPSTDEALDAGIALASGHTPAQVRKIIMDGRARARREAT